MTVNKQRPTYLVASGADNRLSSPSRMTLKVTRSNGMKMDVTNSGIASVAHITVANTNTARHRLASTLSTTRTFNNTTKMTTEASKKSCFIVNLKCPAGVWTSRTPFSGSTRRVPPRVRRVPGSPVSPRRSLPIICRQTVSRSHAMCSRWCIFNCRFAALESPRVTHRA